MFLDVFDCFVDSEFVVALLFHVNINRSVQLAHPKAIGDWPVVLRIAIEAAAVLCDASRGSGRGEGT